MYPANHVEPAAFIFHLNKDFECAAPTALCGKKEERGERRKSLSMPNVVKKSNIACRSCILFQFLKAPAPGWSSSLLTIEALRSCACSSSSGCHLLLALPEKSCLQQSASVLHVMQKRLLLTALSPEYSYFLFYWY